MFKEWNGWIVPTRDAEHVLNRRVIQCEDAFQRVKACDIQRRVMVQAGANWGYWPIQFTRLFTTIYTFEPDHVCFTCLTTNSRNHGSVVTIQAALGDKRELVDLWRDHDTTGNQKIDGPGIYPTLRIDDLNLPVCDLIYLDIEGQEPQAVLGAAETIRRCRPIVVIEETHLDLQQTARAYLMSHGYKADDHLIGNKDVVMRLC